MNTYKLRWLPETRAVQFDGRLQPLHDIAGAFWLVGGNENGAVLVAEMIDVNTGERTRTELTIKPGDWLVLMPNLQHTDGPSQKAFQVQVLTDRMFQAMFVPAEHEPEQIAEAEADERRRYAKHVTGIFNPKKLP